MTNWRLTWFSGSDTYLYTLAKELIRRGHEVDVYTDNAGLAARHFIDNGVNVITEEDLYQNKLEPYNVSFALKESYDVIHAHHNQTIKNVDQMLPDVPKVFVCHGVLPGAEKPPKGVYIDKYVSVSDETKEMLEEDFNKTNVSVIRNFVDTDRFKKRKVKKRKKLKILVLSNYYFGEWDASEIWEATKDLDAELNVVGGNGTMAWDVEPYIQEADIVIGLGRGILEAMACEKPVIVGDYNGYDGAITTEFEYKTIRKSNFSGRSDIIIDVPDAAYIKTEIERIMSVGIDNIGKQNREFVLKYHDVKKAADKFEQIYKKVKRK